MKAINKLLFRMIRETKGQFIAVTAVLAVGLIFYTAMGVSAVNFERGMYDYYDEYAFADLSCVVTGVSAGQLRALENTEGVAAVSGRVTETAPFLTGDDDDGRAKVVVITVNPDNSGINRLYLEDGALLTEESREVLVIRQFAQARGISPGDEITLQIAGRAVDFSVAGIVSSPEFVYLTDPEQGILPDKANYGVVYMNDRIGRQLLGYPGSYNDIQILATPGLGEDELDDLAERIDDRLGEYGSRGVVKRENQLSNAMIASEIGELNTMSSALPVLFLLIAALILAMMLGRMVKRDIGSIGIMKGLGYSSARVLLHYVKYSLLVAAVGGFVGATVGMVLAGFMTTYYMEFYNLPNLNRIVDYQYILISLLLAGAFCVAAGLFGARGVKRVSPAESMIAEAPKPGKKILLERLRIVWKRLSFSNKMAVKNVFRNKKRTAFVLVGVLVTYGMMVFVVCMPAMMSDMMGDGIEEFQPMDYNVSFKRPVSERAISQIKHIVDDVSEIEGKAEYPFLISSGQRELALSIIGVERDTVFYNFRNKAGNKIYVPEDGLLISDYAANELRVGVGDRVKLHSYLSDEDDSWAYVRGIVYQAMGVNGYMNRDALAREYFTPGVVTGFFMNADDAAAESKLMKLPAVSSVSSIAATREIFRDYTRIMNAFIFFMVFLAGILGFAIVYNATVISIGEREREFSSLRVLGFSVGDIFRLLLKENNVISAAGFIAGVPLANVFLRYSSGVFSTEQYTMHLSAGVWNYLQGMIATVFFIVLAQAATYIKIQKLDFMAALKNRA